MNTPLVLSACPIEETSNNSKNNKIKSHLPDPPIPFQKSNAPNLSKPAPESSNGNQGNENVNNLKNLIYNIHENASNEDSSSLGEYVPPQQQSSKVVTQDPAGDNDAYSLKYNPAYVKHDVSNSNPNYPSHTSFSGFEPDDLTEKLNYLIFLMEQQRDIKGTQTVEELLLYSFLGVFLIYVLDSFTKIGKYKR